MVLTEAPNSRARLLANLASRVWLMVAKILRSTSFLITMLDLISSFSESSLTVMPSEIVISRVMGGGAAGVARRVGRGTRPSRAGALSPRTGRAPGLSGAGRGSGGPVAKTAGGRWAVGGGAAGGGGVARFRGTGGGLRISAAWAASGEPPGNGGRGPDKAGPCALAAGAAPPADRLESDWL